MSASATSTSDSAGCGRSEKHRSVICKPYSSRNLPSHTNLEYREYGQNTGEESKNRDSPEKFEEREREEETPSSHRRMIEETREAVVPNKKPKLDKAPAELQKIEKEKSQKEQEKRHEEERIRRFLSCNPLLIHKALSPRPTVIVRRP